MIINGCTEFFADENNTQDCSIYALFHRIPLKFSLCVYIYMHTHNIYQATVQFLPLRNGLISQGDGT